MGYIEELREVVGSRPLNLAGVAVAVSMNKDKYYFSKGKMVFGVFLVDSLNLVNPQKKLGDEKCSKKQGLK